MDELERAGETVRAVAKTVVARHREVGVLTWALLHQLESEVLYEAARTGDHNKTVLNMLRAPSAMAYPKNDEAASLAGHGFVPIVFGEIVKAWIRVH